MSEPVQIRLSNVRVLYPANEFSDNCGKALKNGVDLIQSAFWASTSSSDTEVHYPKFFQQLGFDVIEEIIEPEFDLEPPEGKESADAEDYKPSPPEGYVLAWDFCIDDDRDGVGAYYIRPKTRFANKLMGNLNRELSIPKVPSGKCEGGYDPDSFYANIFAFAITVAFMLFICGLEFIYRMWKS